jgi:hypothetical protein
MPLRSQEIPFRAQAIAVGDFTGDGTLKLAISDGQGVYIYDFDPKAGIKELWKDPGITTDNIIALDAADINGNGVTEIFVTNFTYTGGNDLQQYGRLRSYVLEYRQGKFVRISDDVPLHFRVIEGPSGTPLLIAQAAGQDMPFYGPVRQYTWQGSLYGPGMVIPLPKQFPTIYGFALADLDSEGAPKTVILDQLDHLRVFDRGGTEIYRSSDRYGGSEIALGYDPGRPGADSRGGYTQYTQQKTTMVQGRMYFQDILGDGKKQLIVPKNTPSTGYIFNTRLYDKGKIFGLRWDGLGIQSVWETRELPGYVADYALIDPDGSGNRKLILLVVQTNLLGMTKSRSSVVVLDLRPSG